MIGHEHGPEPDSGDGADDGNRAKNGGEDAEHDGEDSEYGHRFSMKAVRSLWLLSFTAMPA